MKTPSLIEQVNTDKEAAAAAAEEEADTKEEEAEIKEEEEEEEAISSEQVFSETLALPPPLIIVSPPQSSSEAILPNPDCNRNPEPEDPNPALASERGLLNSEFCNPNLVAAIGDTNPNIHGNSSASQEDPKPIKASFSLWNAVVRDPMRRLQEHFLGSRWIPAAEASKSSSIWLLGVFYSISEDGSASASSLEGDITSTEPFADFRNDYSSRIWLTYRKGFEALGPVKATSDVGWGCMLRSGQMLLAQALVCHYLGRNWRRKPSEPNAREYLAILQCFGDAPLEDCPFSIHNILEAGGPYGLVGGSWLGPYALCRSLEAVARSVREKSKNNMHECKLPLEVYVVSGDADGERGGAPCICMDDIERLCSNSNAVNSDNKWTPLLLLVPLVLGLEKVNSRYLPSLWATFTFPQSMGIMGGKRGASTYLVGVQDDQVLYLDPHEAQQVVLVSPDDMGVDTSSYHCSVIRKMPLNAIDPSLALGFYCRDRADFVDLCTRASELARESSGAPMFTVVENNSPRVDTLPAEMGTDAEQGPSEEDWQIL